MNTPLELFCQIIQHEMNLDNSQVFLWDQKIFLPTDQRLYVTVSVESCKPFGNSRTYIGSGNNLQEQQSVNMQATLGVNLLSRGPDARDRKEEVILALKSTYSQALQEANGFYVATLSDRFINLSEIDGAAIPYRFHIYVNIQYQVSKTKNIPFYSQFADTIVTEA